MTNHRQHQAVGIEHAKPGNNRVAPRTAQAVSPWRESATSDIPPSILRRSRPTVELQIDELLLDGFTPSNCQRIARALEAELSRLIAESGTPQSWQQKCILSELRGPMFRADLPGTPQELGRKIARALYEGS